MGIPRLSCLRRSGSPSRSHTKRRGGAAAADETGSLRAAAPEEEEALRGTPRGKLLLPEEDAAVEQAVPVRGREAQTATSPCVPSLSVVEEFGPKPFPASSPEDPDEEELEETAAPP